MPSDQPNSEIEQPRYPIREVTRRTGIPTVTLRAWERRYGLVVPSRTSKGHRLYSEAQIAELNRVADWIARGVPVSRVREVLKGQLPGEELPATDWPASQQQLLTAIANFDAIALEQQLNHLRRELPGAQLATKLLHPLLAELRGQRHQGPLKQAGYRFALSALRDALMHQLRLQHKSSGAPRVGWLVIGDEYLELRTLIDTLAVPACRPHWLGRNLPLDALASVLQSQPLTSLFLVTETPLSASELRQLGEQARGCQLPLYLCAPASAATITDRLVIELESPDALNSRLKND
ncbi:MerR family transcriptional regulator [Motiliproteus sediminis]|uniref:MerR family transcriptional regulator n=1 Tax=Motiliproteus sediminis TaxID=1468178 RepID=UPI001AEF9819|nr:MerR family transcriptional regulator [Motiliproteus sediminis]